MDHSDFETYSSPVSGSAGELKSLSPRGVKVLPQSFARISERRGISRDEMNLAEFPISVLSTRADNSTKTLEFADTVKGKNGQLTERKWIITGADKFGLPTSSDEEVLLGLIKLTVDAGFESRKIFFTRYELMRILRWAPEGRNYTRLQRALDRLSGVRIKASNAFFDNESKAYSTRNFGVVDAYEINDGRGASVASSSAGAKGTPTGLETSLDSEEELIEEAVGEGSEGLHHEENLKGSVSARKARLGSPKPSFFIWSEVIFKSFQGGFIKRLDLDFYLDLKSAVSKRLYRYLDKHFWYRSAMRMNVFTLAHEKLGISRSYQHVSSIRQQLDPALEELLKLQFLTKVEYDGRGKGTEIIVTRSVMPTDQTLPHEKSRPSTHEPVPYVTPYQTRNVPRSSQDTSGLPYQDTSPRHPCGSESAANAERDSSSIGNNEAFSERKTAYAENSLASSAERNENLRSEIEQLLIARGLKSHQLPRLLHGRDFGMLLRIREIISHFDSLQAKRSPLVNRSPVGFLYKAVEAPERFSLPSERRGEKRGDRQQPLAFRSAAQHAMPVSSGGHQRSHHCRDSERDRGSQTASYLVARHNEIKRLLHETEPVVLERLRTEVRNGLSRIKASISPEGFEKAVEHGLTEKLLALFKFSSFEEWKREREP